MNETETTFRNDVAAALADSPMVTHEDAGDHPEIEALVAYHLGEQPPDLAAPIEDHLVACVACRDQLLSLADFVRAPAQSGGAADSIETAAAWRDLRSRLRPPDEQQDTAPTSRPAIDSTLALPAAGRWQALAAAMALTTLGLAFWTARQRATIADLEAPRPTEIITFAGIERAVAAPEAITAEAFVAELTLPLSVDPARFSTFEVAVLDRAGDVVQSVSVAARPEALSVSVHFPRSSLPEGRLTLVLSGLTASQPSAPEEIARWDLSRSSRAGDRGTATPDNGPAG